MFLEWGLFSICFSFLVFIIFRTVKEYILYYINRCFSFSWFNIILKYFVVSIVILIFRKNFLCIFFFWEGLGLRSYFLVIFYINWKSFFGGVSTLLQNRVGDFGGILLFYFFLKNIFYVDIFVFWVILFGLVWMIFSKRAVLPFCSWLPLAIIAPTPISALVHSSTLVASGVLLFFKFFRFFMGVWVFIFIIFFSLISILYRGAKRLFEKDYKKIIAFSTLSQVSLVLFVGALNLKFLIFFHLLSHASIKFLLFLVFGELILQNFGNQDFRKMFCLLFFLKKIIGIICVLGLLGLYFLSVSISKEIIFSYFIIRFKSVLVFIVLLVRIGFTIFYSFLLLKIMYIKFLHNLSFYSSFLKDRVKIVLLILLRGLILLVFSWNFFFSKLWIISLFFWVFIILFLSFYFFNLKLYFILYFLGLVEFIWSFGMKIIFLFDLVEVYESTQKFIINIFNQFFSFSFYSVIFLIVIIF